MTTPPPRRTFSRRRLWHASLLVALVACLTGAAWLVRDPEPRMLERRSQLVRVVPGTVVRDGACELQDVRLESASGLAVEMTIKRPAERGAPHSRPLAILLGGHRRGRNAVQFIPDCAGIVVAALSYPYSGEPKPDALEFVRDIPNIREAFLDTPPAIMLALDHLLQNTEIDRERVEVVGVSLGGPFVTIAAALDDRIRRVWVVHGSGGSYGPLEVSMRREIPLPGVRHAAAALSALIINGPQMAPERWASRIAPRPFMMINASADERMPRALVERLYDSAREPKQIVWLPGGHVRSSAAVLRPLVDTVMAMMENMPPTAAPPASDD